MKTTMLDYVKLILTKVSFDQTLFKKEYRKSLAWISEKDAKALNQWLRQHGYGAGSNNGLNEKFNN
jgi:type IV secretory pathway TrbF-like protein